MEEGRAKTERGNWRLSSHFSSSSSRLSSFLRRRRHLPQLHRVPFPPFFHHFAYHFGEGRAKLDISRLASSSSSLFPDASLFSYMLLPTGKGRQSERYFEKSCLKRRRRRKGESVFSFEKADFFQRHLFKNHPCTVCFLHSKTLVQFVRLQKLPEKRRHRHLVILSL